MNRAAVRKRGGPRSARRDGWAAVFGAVLLAIFSVSTSVSAAQAFTGRVSQVPDGDTLWVLPDAGGPPRKLRIDGIDAPETCQPGGTAAREALAGMAVHRRVEVTVKRYDDFGRGLARIRLDGQDLGARLVREGHAWSYRYRRNPGPYVAQEQAARSQRRGLFSQDAPEAPRQFRQRHGPCPMPPRAG